MLLRFSVENFLSFREPIELLMTASSLKDDTSGLIRIENTTDTAVLSAALVYGANASGKSNLITALGAMRNTVLYSHSRGTPDGGTLHDPFALDPEYASRPSVFEIDFVRNGTRYRYGFEVNAKSFSKEWLYAFPNQRPQRLFVREDQNYTFGRALRGRNQTIADLTRPNSLFISAAAQNDHVDLTPIYTFFRDMRISDSLETRFIDEAYFRENDVDPKTIEFLKSIGTGVATHRRKEVEVPEKLKIFQKGINELIKKTAEVPPDDFPLYDKQVQIELGHLGKNGEFVFFDLGMESAGTRRLLVQLQQIYRALANGWLIVVDELDASVHTKVSELILELFSSPTVNTNGAQLVATIHDTNLLNSQRLRRDQIWFAEKDATGASVLFPLTDISTRKGDNIERGYLQGRFGAIPFAGSVDSLIRGMHEE